MIFVFRDNFNKRIYCVQSNDKDLAWNILRKRDFGGGETIETSGAIDNVVLLCTGWPSVEIPREEST